MGRFVNKMKYNTWAITFTSDGYGFIPVKYVSFLSKLTLN